MTDEREGYGLLYGYDYRSGNVLVEFVYPGGGPVRFQVRLSDLLRMVPAHELEVHAKTASEPFREPLDVEAIRRAAVAATEVEGKVVLDVGGYMGEFAKMCLDRGAARAIVLDTEQWRHYGWRDERKEGVEFVKGDLMGYRGFGEGLASEVCGSPLPRPDVLILYNVLYHVRNPLAFLERAREIIAPGGTMLLCTLVRYHPGAWVYFYEPRECNPEDESVFFGPSIEALERWLTATGWEYQQEGLAFDRVVYRCTATREIQWRESRA